MPKAPAVKVQLGDKTYDLSEVGDVAQIQSLLVPDNWPGNRADCVRLFLQTSDILAHQFKRHLAHNWKLFCKIAQEAKEDDEPARISASFGFELDQSAPQVAAVTKIKMSTSVQHSTQGKPVSKDINQGDFLDDMSEVLDTSRLDAEMAPPPPPPEPPAGDDKPKARGRKGKGTVEQFPGGKKPRGRPKKDKAGAGDSAPGE